MQRQIVIVLLTLILAACKGGSGAADTVAAEELTACAYTVVAQGAGSGYSLAGGVELGEVSLLTLKTQAELEAFWALHTANQSPASPAPVVDFAAHMLLVLIAPVCPSGGYALELGGIYRAADAIRVEATRTSPGAGCITSSELTQPFMLVEMERSDLPLSLHVSTRGVACE